MKKLIATLVTLVVLSMATLPAAAQTRSRYNNRANSGRTYSSDARYRDSQYRSQTYRNDVYANDNYYGQDRSVWDKHRDKITTAGGALGGALLGGLIGGKKGALIGAITGGAGAAVYTYKIRDKVNRY